MKGILGGIKGYLVLILLMLSMIVFLLNLVIHIRYEVRDIINWNKYSHIPQLSLHKLIDKEWEETFVSNYLPSNCERKDSSVFCKIHLPLSLIINNYYFGETGKEEIENSLQDVPTPLTGYNISLHLGKKQIFRENLEEGEKSCYGFTVYFKPDETIVLLDEFSPIILADLSIGCIEYQLFQIKEYKWEPC